MTDKTSVGSSNPSNELPEGHWRLFSYDHLVQECMSLSRALNDNSLDSDSGTARMLLERVLFEMRPLVAKNVRLQRDIEVFLSTGAAPETRARRCGWFGEGRGQCLLEEGHETHIQTRHHVCEQDGRLLDVALTGLAAVHEAERRSEKAAGQ